MIAAFLPRQAEAIDTARDYGATTSAVQDDLHRITGTPAFRSALARCRDVFIPDARPLPLLANWLERSPDSIRLAPDWEGKRRRAGSSSSTASPGSRSASASPTRRRRPGAMRSRPADAPWRRTPRGWS